MENVPEDHGVWKRERVTSAESEGLSFGDSGICDDRRVFYSYESVKTGHM
jgi:hypothetical protein